MNLILRLSSILPREIVSSAFFLIHPPTEEDIIEACHHGKSLLIERWIFHGVLHIAPDDTLPLWTAVESEHLKIISMLLPLYNNVASVTLVNVLHGRVITVEIKNID